MMLCDISVEKRNDESNEQRKQLGLSLISIVMMLFSLCWQRHDQQEVMQVTKLRFFGVNAQASIHHLLNMPYCGYKIKCRSLVVVDRERIQGESRNPWEIGKWFKGVNK
jgi:hypothetical protein